MCCWFVFIAPPFSFSCDRYGTSRKKGEKTVNPFFFPVLQTLLPV